MSVTRSFGLSFLKAFLAAVFIFSVLPAVAQHSGGSSHPTPTQPSPPPQPPSPPPATTRWDENDLIYGKAKQPDSGKIAHDDSCFLPPLDGPPPASVKVSDLQIPAKAKREYGNGCQALRKSKLVDAEHHFRKAVNQWPKYPAAWVVLGQVLEAQQKTNAATDACSQPLATESTYLPSLLCLADISARAQNWDKVLSLSNRALTIDSTTVAVAYDYNAAANFHLHNLSEAEKSALRAVEIDKNNIDPRVHFLLAQIYDAKGDRTLEATQLREYLKYASNPNDVKMIKGYLADIEKRAQ
ncbi:MAG TPA: hypothetical protein VGS27_10380 [Candidatus Sulfotelmatobacter sp.]|nr:hypothetical protein [Candidatus Sulfotelmatobacter sp.]